MTTLIIPKKFKCYPSYNGLTNVIESIEWTLKVTETINGKTYVLPLELRTKLPDPNSADFTQIDLITNEQVITWISQIENITKYANIAISRKNGELAKIKTVEFLPPA